MDNAGDSSYESNRSEYTYSIKKIDIRLVKYLFDDDWRSWNVSSSRTRSLMRERLGL